MRIRRCLSLLLSLLVALLPVPPVHAGYETGYRPMEGDGTIVAQGLDLSAWQGHAVDFEKIKAQGYSFVILRIGYATTMDSCFEENYARAKAAGLDIGVYLYSYADTVQEALVEAAACKAWLHDKLLEYPVYYDLEEPEKHYLMSNTALTTLALAFMDEMAADGWLTGLYSCRSWFDSKYELSRITGSYECWIAQYFSSGTYEAYTQYTANYGMWQYSASGEVDGVPGNADMNVCFRDYPAICRQYGFNGYPATGETLWLQGGQAPDVLVTGQGLSLAGRLISTAGTIESVSVELLNADGVLRLAAAVSPKAERYELSQLGGKLKLERLGAGCYTLRLKAVNREDERVLLEQSLVLSAAGLRLDEANQPGSLREGDTVSLTGIVRAATTIDTIEIGVRDRNGRVLLSQTARPAVSAYDIAALAGALDFSSLTLGSYQYYILATTEAGSQTLLNQSFQVWVRSDPIVLVNATLEESYLPGALQGLGGTIRSTDSALRQVTACIYTASGEVATEAKLNLNTKSTAMARLDALLSFSALKSGSYRMVITALNDAGPQTVLSKSFTIVPDAISLCAPSLPSILPAGDSFCISGLLTSDQTALKSVSVTVTAEDGRRVLHTAVLPERNCFDLAELNGHLLFSTLAAGSYTLRIAAENGTAYTTLYDAPLYITDGTDLLYWENGCYRPGGRSYNSGNAPLLWGKLCATESDIEEVRVEIFAQSGRLVTQASRSVFDSSVTLQGFNEQLRLSALADGTYLYRLTATNASGAYILVQEQFSLSSCPHSDTIAGAHIAPTCTAPGAVTDSHCRLCGAKTADGTLLAAHGHSYHNAQCSDCGAAEPNTITLQKTHVLPGADAWLVLAIRKQDAWYALDETGTLVPLLVSAAGEIQVPRTCTWRLREKQNGAQSGYAIANAAGALLHQDSDGMQIAYGTMHTLVELVPAGDAFRLCFLHCRDTPLTLDGTQELHLFARETASS